MGSEGLGGGDWRKLFVDRNVWVLTPDYIDIWRSQNKTFFGYIDQYVTPSGRITELGCGPGRHAITKALMGYRVLAIDIDTEVLEQASRNAAALVPAGAIQFRQGNIFELDAIPELKNSDAMTHGGLMEHFDSEDAVRRSLWRQLEHAPYVIFDVPLGTAKNKQLFAGDGVFRQQWTSEVWIEEVLRDFRVVAWKNECHDHPSMTDDLICVLGR